VEGSYINVPFINDNFAQFVLGVPSTYNEWYQMNPSFAATGINGLERTYVLKSLAFQPSTDLQKIFKNRLKWRDPTFEKIFMLPVYRATENLHAGKFADQYRAVEFRNSRWVSDFGDITAFKYSVYEPQLVNTSLIGGDVTIGNSVNLKSYPIKGLGFVFSPTSSSDSVYINYNYYDLRYLVANFSLNNGSSAIIPSVNLDNKNSLLLAYEDNSKAESRIESGLGDAAIRNSELRISHSGN